MKKFMTAVVMALGTGGFTASASAQEPALTAALGQLKDGASIAIREADGSQTTGRFVGATRTLLTLKTREGRSLDVPLDRVRRVSVDDPVRDGVLMGAGIGGGSGIVTALALCGTYDGNCDGGAATLLMGAIGAGVGAAIGAIADSTHVRIAFDARRDHAKANAPLSASRGFRTGINVGFSW
jgi:hypothetical protein